MKNLIFIGGAKGVGKSTLIEHVRYFKDIPVINTGKIYIQAKNANKNPELEIINALKTYEGIVDTHYAGYFGNGFVRALSEDNLKELAVTVSLDCILVEINLEQLLTRRHKDSQKDRIIDINHAGTELEENKKHFLEYCKNLNIDGLILANESIEQSVQQILRRIYDGR